MWRKKRLKIAQVAPFYFPAIGGVEQIVQNISEDLVKRGHQVHVFTVARDHNRNLINRPTLENFNGVFIHRFRSFINLSNMSLFPGFIFSLLKGRFDIIHLHAYRHPHTELGNLVGRLKFIPTILHGHSPFHPKEVARWRIPYYFAYDLIAKYTILKRVNLIFALTPLEKEKYIKRGASEKKIIIMPNCVPDEYFDKVDPTSFIKKYSLIGKKTILFIGRLDSGKRLDLLIEALPQIIQATPNAFLLVVGPDQGYYTCLIQLIKKLKVQNYVKWVGPLYGVEKLQAYSACDFLVLPSDWEAFSVVLIEAMTVGKPGIAINSGGSSEIIENGQTGFLVERGNLKELENAILTLLQDHDLAKKMGEKARIRAEDFRLSKMVDKIESIYYDLNVKY